MLGAGGVWDVFARGQVRDIGTLRRRAPRVPGRLWLAARDHFGSEWTEPSSPSPHYEADPALKEEAVTRSLGPAPAWYHLWLGSNGSSPAPPGVTYQIAGEGWRESATWPPAGARRTSVHLAPSRDLVERQDEYLPGARRFDVGQRTNFQLTPMALAAIQQLLDWTVPRVAATLQARTDEIASRTEGLGLAAPPPHVRAPHMLGLELPPKAARQVAAALAEAKVVASMRGTSLRISPHLHNNQEDVDRLVDAVPRPSSRNRTRKGGDEN